MDFLFADSTTTGFQTNFLEALRDAIDFAASIALSDERIGTAEDRIRALQVNADAQASRLEQLARSVLSVLDLEKGPPGSPSDILASELGPTVSARHQAVAASITEKLGEDIRFIAAETLAARNRYRTALEAYLLARDPPDATTVLRLALVDGGKDDDTYEATLVGRSDMGLMWSIDLQVPPKTMWAAALRVDRVVDGLEILAPQQAGLIKRAVKVKKQKLNRYVVTSFADDGTTVRVELRLELGGEAGFDLSANLRKSEISATRIGAADDAAAGAFEVSADDTRALLDFATKLRAGALALPRKRLAEATFDGAPFDGTIVDAQPRLVGIVERLIAKVAPTVREIAARSHTRDELVLRRQLADGRREEIFLPTSVLRDKVAALGDAHRALFAPLGLEARALESVEQSDAVVDTTEIEEPAQEKQEENGESEGEPSAPSDEVADTEEHETSVIIRSEVPPSSHPPVSPAEPSSHGPPSSRGDLAASLKDIRALSREGRTEDAHRAFAAFFRSSAFTSARADDQRLALKLLVLPKPPSTISDAMKDAFEAAIGPLQSLILAHREPADYEMLGAAYVVLGEPVKATGIFKKALDLERARNPASDLCGNLMRRVSEI